MKWLLTFLLDYFIQKVWPRLVGWGLSRWNKRKRAKDQEAKQEKIEADVESGAERTEEVRKREEDWLNS